MSNETDLPADEACVNCRHAAGIVIHQCACPKSEFYGGAVAWEGWCPEFEPNPEQES